MPAPSSKVQVVVEEVEESSIPMSLSLSVCDSGVGGLDKATSRWMRIEDLVWTL